MCVPQDLKFIRLQNISHKQRFISIHTPKVTRNCKVQSAKPSTSHNNIALPDGLIASYVIRFYRTGLITIIFNLCIRSSAFAYRSSIPRSDFFCHVHSTFPNITFTSVQFSRMTWERCNLAFCARILSNNMINISMYIHHLHPTTCCVN